MISNLEIISHAVWLCNSFGFSFRDTEDLLAQFKPKQAEGSNRIREADKPCAIRVQQQP